MRSYCSIPSILRMSKRLKDHERGLKVEKGLEVEENPSIEKKDAIKIFNKWIESDNQVLDILKNRYRELKEIGIDLVEKHGEHMKETYG
jgi:hypothetical protein